MNTKNIVITGVLATLLGVGVLSCGYTLDPLADRNPPEPTLYQCGNGRVDRGVSGFVGGGGPRVPAWQSGGQYWTITVASAEDALAATGSSVRGDWTCIRSDHVDALLGEAQLFLNTGDERILRNLPKRYDYAHQPARK